MGQSKLRAEGTAALCKTGRLYRNVVFLSLVILLSAQYYNCTHVQAPLDSFWFFRFSHLQIFKPLLLVFQFGTILSFYSNYIAQVQIFLFEAFQKLPLEVQKRLPLPMLSVLHLIWENNEFLSSSVVIMSYSNFLKLPGPQGVENHTLAFT